MPFEAEELAKRITQTWRTGASKQIWEEALLELDAGTAGAAYARLRRESEHAPSIAGFIAFSRTLHTEANEAPVVPWCEQCDSTGFVPLADLLVSEHPYSQVAPCTYCATGKARVSVHRMIVASNDRGRSVDGGPS
jgi:hypothetical protein